MFETLSPRLASESANKFVLLPSDEWKGVKASAKVLLAILKDNYPDLFKDLQKISNIHVTSEGACSLQTPQSLFDFFYITDDIEQKRSGWSMEISECKGKLYEKLNKTLMQYRNRITNAPDRSLENNKQKNPLFGIIDDLHLYTLLDYIESTPEFQGYNTRHLERKSKIPSVVYGSGLATLLHAGDNVPYQSEETLRQEDYRDLELTLRSIWLEASEYVAEANKDILTYIHSSV